jgi:hypothetical protein
MSDIVQTLRDLADCTHSDLSVASEAADELTRLTAEVEKWKQLDREAATYVESVICLKSNRFTGNPPYVGWKGLGLALKEDYDELARLTAEVERLRAALENMVDLCMHATPDAFCNGNTDSTGTIDEGDMRAGRIIDEARAALKEDRNGVS